MRAQTVAKLVGVAIIIFVLVIVASTDRMSSSPANAAWK